MSFVTPEILAKLGKLTRADADAAEYGIVQLDPAGRILVCNAYASKFLKKPANELEGRNFFLHAAPCTGNRIFQGRFANGVASGRLNLGFDYAWLSGDRAILVRVHLIHDRVSKTQWVFFQSAPDTPEAASEIHASMEEQLAALYQERASPLAASPAPTPAFAEPVSGPEGGEPAPAELETLRREKEALAAELKAIKSKAREIGAAMFEAALLGKDLRRKASGE